MSLYGVLRTGVSGMSAQSSKLSTIADNIANTGTTGYKRASTEFSSLLLQAGANNYGSGSVVTDIRYAVSEQGPTAYTRSGTDLAIGGRGFFVVSDPSGSPYLTRAGSFTVDGGTGNLVNTAGYTLMGYDIRNGMPDSVLNGTSGLRPINLSDMNMEATASQSGTFRVNLPADAAVAAGDTPADNLATSTYAQKSSVVAYDNLGKEVMLDIYMTKTVASPPEWEVTVFDKSTAAAGGGFPYTAGPLDTQTLAFDAGGILTPAAAALSVAVPNGATLSIDMSGTTQLAADFTPLKVTVDGNAPSMVAETVIGEDGTVYAVYENGARAAAFRIPLVDVPSPDNLTPRSGNVFSPSLGSGDIQSGFATEAGLGSIVSGALEQSNVDMASELTAMIVAQRDYTANSKVFQTGSELLDVLMSLKR